MGRGACPAWATCDILCAFRKSFSTKSRDYNDYCRCRDHEGRHSSWRPARAIHLHTSYVYLPFHGHQRPSHRLARCSRCLQVMHHRPLSSCEGSMIFLGLILSAVGFPFIPTQSLSPSAHLYHHCKQKHFSLVGKKLFFHPDPARVMKGNTNDALLRESKTTLTVVDPGGREPACGCSKLNFGQVYPWQLPALPGPISQLPA